MLPGGDGTNKASEDFISLYLNMESCESEAAMVDYQINVLNSYGNEIASMSSNGPRKFERGRASWGSRKLIRRDTLFCKYWLPEGKLVISCDIRYAADPVVATDRRPLTHSESSD